MKQVKKTYSKEAPGHGGGVMVMSCGPARVAQRERRKKKKKSEEMDADGEVQWSF